MQLESMLSSEELNEMVNIYDQWEVGKNYIEGQKVAYNNLIETEISFSNNLALK